MFEDKKKVACDFWLLCILLEWFFFFFFLLSFIVGRCVCICTYRLFLPVCVRSIVCTQKVCLVIQSMALLFLLLMRVGGGVGVSSQFVPLDLGCDRFVVYRHSKRGFIEAKIFQSEKWKQRAKKRKEPHLMLKSTKSKWRKQRTGRRLKASQANTEKERRHFKRIFASDIFRFEYDYSNPSNNSVAFQMFRCIILHFVHYKHKLSHLNMLRLHIVCSGRKISLSAFGQTTFIYHCVCSVCAKTLNNVQSLWVCVRA